MCQKSGGAGGGGGSLGWLVSLHPFRSILSDVEAMRKEKGGGGANGALIDL